MKKNSIFKYITGIVIGILLTSIVGVYAVTAIIDSKEVSYDNENSKGSYDNVQGSIDELYKRYKDLSGEQDTIYKEEILNGADPVLGDGMIPITLEDDGTVKYANLYTPWYKYASKRWANAVILVKNPSKSYKTGDTILEKDIESYFVWIPRYSYKIWNLGNYTNYNTLSNLNDENDQKDENETEIRHLANNLRLISIRFGKSENITTIPTIVGSYYTHPAFTNFGVNGLWVGKFEITGNSSNLTVKPNLTSWRNEKVGTFWNTLFNYKNISGSHNTNLDPHMMKNTEWGAVAYLSHSIYGIGTGININNNSDYITGYSATAETNQISVKGEDGTEDSVTQPWNTTTGYLASTTGNITGIYDMSGGAHEYMASYMYDYGILNKNGIESGLTANDLTTYSKYFEIYYSSGWVSYNKRILGDATGELGPFYFYHDFDGATRIHSAWYADISGFVENTNPWFMRGGYCSYGVGAGQFFFDRANGDASNIMTTRLVLTVK